MEKLFTCFILLVAAVLLVPGCYAEETPMTTDANATEVTPVEDVALVNTTFTADVNTTELTMAMNDTVRVALSENPTTGYMWNVTNSSGLAIINDSYVMDAAPEGMVGVGGVHEWILQAVEVGNQTFSGVYMRSFETPTGEEDTYTLDVTVE